MAHRTRENSWIEEPSDMLEKLHHDRERLRKGISNLRDDPREAHYAAYDFLITAWHTVEDWLNEGYGLSENGLFDLAQDVANGVKHFETKEPEEETYTKGGFSSGFSHGFDIDHLYLDVTEEAALRAKEGAKDRGLDSAIVRDETEIPVLPLADRLIACLEQEIHE